ncbi:hypothetical protein LTR62_007740 [Meristemomyces frigidus]|uniref:Zn(2)-C6 fungal-type domain-containing protein n=1 Tax=Meristemomyces frigidus TaxID=1508187 RepID=A0AAN7YDC2_9PEZI|nr:hypothetical protein LTR62_007740 [Meristemomyces frigidus]
MSAWVLETPGGDDNQKSLYNETGARRRRAHPKSRKGCTHCKQRRVKCDETRPTCGQCAERNWTCEYPAASKKGIRLSPSPQPSGRSLDSETPPTSISDSGSPAQGDLARSAIHSQVVAVLERSATSSRAQDPSTTQPHLAIELVDHFLDTTEMWIGSPVSQGIIQKHAFPMALHASYLLHAVLACAAKHLSWLRPEESKYERAAALHYTRSLQAYSVQLVYDIEHGDANAMISASGLLAKLTLINMVASYGEAPLSREASPTSWIRSMQGVKVILSTPSLRTQLQTGFLLPILQRYGPASPLDADMYFDPHDPHSPTSVLARLRQYCVVAPDDSDPYSPVIAQLAPFILRVPDNDSVDQMMAIVAGVESSFVELLDRFDTRALLILCYWCARLPHIDQWWTGPSAEIECSRICRYLSTVDDERIKNLLWYPFNSCAMAKASRIKSEERDGEVTVASISYG